MHEDPDIQYCLGVEPGSTKTNGAETMGVAHWGKYFEQQARSAETGA